MTGDVERLVDSDFPRLVGIVKAVCGSTSAAEDAVAQACAQAWEREQRGRTFDNLAGWVVVTAIRHTQRSWRHRKAEPGVHRAFQQKAGSDFVEIESLLDLEAALRALPRRQLEATVLHYVLGLSVTETADTLGVSPGTVKTALSRARSALANALRSQEEAIQP